MLALEIAHVLRLDQVRLVAAPALGLGMAIHQLIVGLLVMLEAGRVEPNHVEIGAEMVLVTRATILFLERRV
jgi:hypothetical protein